MLRWVASARAHVNTTVSYLANGWADWVQIWCVARDPLDKIITQVRGEVQLHVRMCRYAPFSVLANGWADCVQIWRLVGFAVARFAIAKFASFAEFAVCEVCGCEFLVARFADASFAVERFAVASLRFAAFRFAIFSLQGERAVRCGAA